MTGRPAGPVRTLLGRAVVMTLVAGGLAAVVGSVAAGLDGLRAALVAVVLVLAFLLVGQLPVAQAGRGGRGLGPVLVLSLYTARLVLLLLAFRAFSVAGQLDRTVLGATVVCCALAWTAGTVWSALRWRPMVVEPAHQPEPGPARPPADRP